MNFLTKHAIGRNTDKDVGGPEGFISCQQEGKNAVIHYIRSFLIHLFTIHPGFLSTPDYDIASALRRTIFYPSVRLHVVDEKIFIGYSLLLSLIGSLTFRMFTVSSSSCNTERYYNIRFSSFWEIISNASLNIIPFRVVYYVISLKKA
jgi:hypothetical protein